MKQFLAKILESMKKSPLKWGGGILLVLGLFCAVGLFMMLFLSGGGAQFTALEPASFDSVASVAGGAASGESEISVRITNGDGSFDDILASARTQQQTRLIIYTGDISLVVKDTNEAVKMITTFVTEMGGYVSSSNIFESNSVPRGNVTVRVAADRYEETLTALRAMALRVERESSNTQDITEEFVDLQARRSNLEFTEAALQDLLEKRERLGTTADILEVHRELTNIRGQIEQIEGRLRYLTDQAALSTITITLIPDVLYQPVQIAGWQPQGVAREALQTLIAALQGVVNILIWLVVFLIPLLIVVLLPLYLLYRLVRWWRQRGVVGS